ncbi:MAG: hypothetical protein ABIP38_12920 [Steroidobacteraceae bacterium]
MLLLSARAPLVQLWTELGSFFELAPAWMYYNVSVLSTNYFDAGFVRRGLGGTLSLLMSTNAYVGGFSFHLLSALLLIIPIVLLQLRLLRGLREGAAALLAVFIVASPQTFMSFAQDIARTDMMAIAAIMWAVLALLGNRPILAAAILLAGSLVHETAVIFGLPLLVVLAATRVDRSAGIRRPLVALMLLLVALVAIAALQWKFGADADTIGAAMRARAPTPPSEWFENLRECAIYMMVAGLRGLRTAMCYNAYYPAYGFHFVMSLGLLALNAFILGLERKYLAVLVAVFVPALFLDAVASDLGRWVKFAAVNTWVLSLVFQSAGTVVMSTKRAIVGFCLLALLLPAGGSRVNHPNPASAHIARWLGFDEAPQVADWMLYCDPDWRKVAGR